MNRSGLFLLVLIALLGGGPRPRRRRAAYGGAAGRRDGGGRARLDRHPRLRRCGPQPGWHGYWRNPGDAGDEPRVTWRLPEGWRAGPLHYPVPRPADRRRADELCFERDYALLVDDRRCPASAEPGATLPDRRADRLSRLHRSRSACPRRRPSPIELRDRRGRRDRNPAFDGYRRALPRPLAPTPARFEVAGGRLRIAIPLPPGDGARRAPISSRRRSTRCAIGEPQSVSRNGDLLIVETGAGPRAGAAAGDRGRAPDRRRATAWPYRAARRRCRPPARRSARGAGDGGERRAGHPLRPCSARCSAG